jgi:ribosomal protein L11 methyltransferase
MGIDIDPIAAETAAKNAGLNGLPEGRFVSRCGELSDTVTGVFDIVCANIVADVIVSLAGPREALYRSGGFFLVSGILAEYAGEGGKGTFEKRIRIAGKWEK